jgi:anthranilate phosphoribosyltransferase
MKPTLKQTFNAVGLSRHDARQALFDLLQPETTEAQIAAFLSIIETRGLTQEEFEGFIEVLSGTATPVDLETFDTIDVCGTGGDGKNTFNISTISALVLAGTGVKVSKHGNASASSGCGSSDVLLRLGVEFTADEGRLRTQLSEAGIVYLHAPLFQPSLNRIGATRRDLGFRTLFNVLGPLLNPARPRFRLAGVSSPRYLRLYRYYLETQWNSEFALVHSRDGYDEISLTSSFDVATPSGIRTYTPEQLGLPRRRPEELSGGDGVERAAELVIEVLEGRGTAAQNDVVVVNAAFARTIVTSEPLETSIARCRESLMDGAALTALNRMIETSK